MTDPAAAARFEGIIREVTNIIVAGIDAVVAELDAAARGFRGWVAGRFVAVAGPLLKARAPALASRAVDVVYGKVTRLTIPELVADLDAWLQKQPARGAAAAPADPDVARLLDELKELLRAR